MLAEFMAKRRFNYIDLVGNAVCLHQALIGEFWTAMAVFTVTIVASAFTEGMTDS